MRRSGRAKRKPDLFFPMVTMNQAAPCAIVGPTQKKQRRRTSTQKQQRRRTSDNGPRPPCVCMPACATRKKKLRCKVTCCGEKEACAWCITGTGDKRQCMACWLNGVAVPFNLYRSAWPPGTKFALHRPPTGCHPMCPEFMAAAATCALCGASACSRCMGAVEGRPLCLLCFYQHGGIPVHYTIKWGDDGTWVDSLGRAGTWS